MSEQEVSYDHAIELASQERYDEALEILGKLSQAQPEVVDYECLRARLLFDKGDSPAAFATLDAALARLPSLTLHPAHRWSSRGVIVHRYGMLLMSDNRFQDALPWLEEAARRNGLASGEWSALYHAGLAHFRLGDAAAAGRYWYDLLYRAPDLGVQEILALTREHFDEAAAAQGTVEPMLRLCLARVGLDNPELMELGENDGDALAAQQAGFVLADEPDHPHARRIRAPLRFRGGDLAGAWDDLAVYQRQVADPRAQVRELELRHQAGEAEPWRTFALNEAGTDAHGYYLAGVALSDFIDQVPEAGTALEPQLIKAWRIALGRFEAYYETGEGGYDDADPHVYSMLCHHLARRLEGQGHRDERIALHEKGIAVSDFIEHWVGLLDCHESERQHGTVIKVAGEVLNRYPVERAPASVGWVFSRLIGAWRGMGGAEAAGAARAALLHMDAQLDGLPIEARSEAAPPMAHARAHLAALIASTVVGLDVHDKADALDEIDALQRRALLVEDAWLYLEFSRIWRGLGNPERALPLVEHAIVLTEGDAEDQAPARVLRGLLRAERQEHAEALDDFDAAFRADAEAPADACLHAVLAAVALDRREDALHWFEKARARGATQGSTRALFARAEGALRTSRPKWKFWGV